MRLLWLLIFFVVLLPTVCYAQKAYEVEHYRGVLQGKTIKLNLANGYIGATEIVFSVTPGKRPVAFIPESGVATVPFILRSNATGRIDYFVLDHIREEYNRLPAYISGKYYSGKEVLVIKFYRGR